MAAKRKAGTKKDLDSRIVELEEKLSKLSTQLESKPTSKPAETTAQQTSPHQQSISSSNEGKSRKQLLEEYENDYLQRIEQERAEQEKSYQEMLEAEAKAKSQSNRGSLPKGFEPTLEPETPKSSKGTLPKGF